MLKAACYAGMFLGLAVMVYGFWLPIAEGQVPAEITPYKCKTLLPPGTCYMGGATYCLSDGTTLCKPGKSYKCGYCDSSVAANSKVCIEYPETMSKCLPNGFEVNCGAMNNVESGKCKKNSEDSDCWRHNVTVVLKCVNSIYKKCNQ
jgi:hypothetical protein